MVRMTLRDAGESVSWSVQRRRSRRMKNIAAPDSAASLQDFWGFPRSFCSGHGGFLLRQMLLVLYPG